MSNSVSRLRNSKEGKITPVDTRSAAYLMKLEDNDAVIKNIQRHHNKHWQYFRKVNSSMFHSQKLLLHDNSQEISRLESLNDKSFLPEIN